MPKKANKDSMHMMKSGEMMPGKMLMMEKPKMKGRNKGVRKHRRGRT